MMPSGPSTPVGNCQTASPSLLRSNSAIMGSQGRQSQVNLSSLVSPRAPYNSNILGNSSNMSSLLQRTFGNNAPSPGHSGQGGFQYGNDRPVQSDPLSMVANEMVFASTPSSFASSNLANHGESGQVQNRYIANSSGERLLHDNRHFQPEQLHSQSYQHDQQSHQQQQQQYQSIQGGVSGLKRVKLEPQIISNQNGPQKHMQSFRNLAPVKSEQQQNQIGQVMGPIKLETQHPDQRMSLHQQQQRQQNQILQLSSQSSQSAMAEMNLFQWQRIVQIQQQQQQQLLKALPNQRNHLQQHFQQQNLLGRSTAGPVYEPGTCARRLTHYMHQQQQRPADNNIDFWRIFVAEFFAPNAKKRWCVSLYGNSRQTNGVFPQEVWHCEICNSKPGRGFETTVEVLPRLYKIKYDSGTLEELLYLDMPREYLNAAGQIVLDYAKVTQESVYEQLRVVRDGQLRVVFSPDLKICSWEFCAWRHEELIPRRLIIPQVSHLGAAAQKYQAAAQNASSNSSTEELQNNCTMFAASGRQLAKALEVPLVNELGYTKRYVRCLQISEVVNSMKDLIDYSRKNKRGPIDSLANFPCQTKGSSALHIKMLQLEQQQQLIRGQKSRDDHSVQQTAIQSPGNSGLISLNNPRGTNTTTSSVVTAIDHLRQNSMNSRHDDQLHIPNSPYALAAPVQIPSAGSSNSLPPIQPNPSSPFSSSTPSSSNNPPQTSQTAAAMPKHISSTNSPAQVSLQQSSQSSDPDPNESQSAVDKIIQEIMSSSQFGGAGDMASVGSVGSNMNNINGIAQISPDSLGKGNSVVGPGGANNMNNSESGNLVTGSIGAVSLPQDNQHEDLNSGLLDGLGILNDFDDLQFDWKSSP